MKLGQDFVFVPESIAHKALHGPDFPLLNGNGNRLDGFSLEGTELPGHVQEEVAPRFTAVEAAVEGFMKAFQFISKIFHFFAFDIEFGNLKHTFFDPGLLRYHRKDLLFG
jgi:hypothetical protein